MIKKKVYTSAFILIALIQLYIPAKMILDQEDILTTGNIYKFKTAPIDPTDPFRGKYITLNYDNNTIEIENDSLWKRNQQVFVLIKNDKNGFAYIDTVLAEDPQNNRDYFKANIRFIRRNEPKKLTLAFPFDRYYMEETKAYEAEIAYRETHVDSSQNTYALVAIKNGESVLKDVLINNVPIKEFVEKQRQAKIQE